MAKSDPALRAAIEQHEAELVRQGFPASESVPTIADLIHAARKATEYANSLQAEVDAARSAARNAFDAVYDELAKLKAESKDMDTFRASKLGKLLENIR